MSADTSTQMDSTDSSKESLRRFCKERRTNLTAAEVKKSSAEITNNLKDTIDWKKIKSIHTYQAIDDQHELDPQPFLDWLQKNNRDIEIYQQDLSSYFPAEQYDAVLVPCIAADKKGFRLGFGGGQYDRFLATQDDAIRFGLCYHSAFFEDIPSEAHDEAMDYVITDRKIIEL